MHYITLPKVKTMIMCSYSRPALCRCHSARGWLLPSAFLCTAIVCLAGCGSPSTTALDYEQHEGTLRGSAYDIRIRWDGDRCVGREIRITRDCGMCRSRNVTNAVVKDFDCDGNTDHMQFRRLDEEMRVDKMALDQDAWLAFHHFVPPLERGLYRH